jgi:hypothetical protein
VIPVLEKMCLNTCRKVWVTFKSESKCTIGSDHNRECGEPEWQNQEVYPLQIFSQAVKRSGQNRKRQCAKSLLVYQ